jgi:hypothetical protein
MSGFDEAMSWGWSVHDSRTPAVAERLERERALADDPEKAARWTHLGNHAIGQHLGDWPRAARLVRERVEAMGTRASAPLLSNLVVALRLSGDEAGSRDAERRAVAAEGGTTGWSRVRTRMLVAEGLAARADWDGATAAYDEGLALVRTLPAGSPAERSVAATSNNLASDLLRAEARSPEQDAAMERAANAAREFWLKIGDWTHDERSDYLLAGVMNALGRHGDALLHAARGLSTIERGGEEPIDAAFLRVALAGAYGGLGLEADGERELAAARKAASTWEDASLRESLDGEIARLPRHAQR